MNSQSIISKYFDSLIRDVDIFTEEQLSKCDRNEVIGPFELKLISDNLKLHQENSFLNENKDLESQIKGEDTIWSHSGVISNQNYFENNKFVFPENFQSIKVHEYLNKCREDMLAELSIAQEEALKRYQTIKNELKRDKTMNIDEWKEHVLTRVLSNKFYMFFAKANFNRYSSRAHVAKLDFYLNEGQRALLR